MNVEQTIFDSEFKQKLKSFYSFDETKRYNSVTGSLDGHGFRVTGRTYTLAKVLLETALESGRELQIQDHYIDVAGIANAIHFMKRQIEYIVSEYIKLGISINLQFHHRYDRFKAVMISGHEIYNRIRIKPFSIIERKVEFLNEELLLL